MTSHNSILRFEDYYVDEFTFERNENFSVPQGEKVELDLDFNFDIQELDDDKFIRKIICTIFDEEYIKNNKPFYLKIIISGIFCLPNFDPDSEKHNEIKKKNTLAILFPYVRTLISHMTLEMQIESVRLPPMNINSFFDTNN